MKAPAGMSVPLAFARGIPYPSEASRLGPSSYSSPAFEFSNQQVHKQSAQREHTFTYGRSVGEGVSAEVRIDIQRDNFVELFGLLHLDVKAYSFAISSSLAPPLTLQERDSRYLSLHFSTSHDFRKISWILYKVSTSPTRA